MPSDPPAYLRIAADLRAQIFAGALGAGAKVPSEQQIRDQYGVSTTVAKTAIALLKNEGLVEGRRGSGTYVIGVTRLTRRAHARDIRTAPGSPSPFARDVEAAGMRPSWDHHSEHAEAPPHIARRLGIEPGDPVMLTRYRFLADDVPIQLSESHEPLAVTGGTEVEWPESGAAVGVVARMDHIGVTITRFVEEIYDRSATPDEVDELGLTLRGSPRVLVIERTYYAGELPVETADIVLAANRYRVRYEVPVDPA